MRVRSIGVAAVMMVALAGACVPVANAQEMRVTVRSTFGGPGDGMVTRRGVENYARLLGLPQEGKDAALALYEGYQAAYQQAQKVRREAMEAVRKEAEESEDHSLFMQKMPAISKVFRETTEAHEKQLFDDLKTAAGGVAPERWERVERMRRREIGLRGGGSGGEGVDLVELVDALKLSPAAMEAVSPVVADYETEIDRNVRAKLKLMEDQRDGFGMNIEPGKMQKMMEDSREVGGKLRDTNVRFEKKIEGMLPEDRRAEFAAAFRRSCFPAVYKPSRATKELDAAMKLEDLESGQREALRALAETYARDAKGANEAWASAIEDQEKSGRKGEMVLGGSRMMMLTGDEPEALKQARQARRDLDKRTRDRLNSILSPGQRDRLPKEEEEDGVRVGGEAVFITSDH